MKLKLITVGKVKDGHIRDIITLHETNISKRVPIELIEVPDEKAKDSLSEREVEAILSTEGGRILQRIDRSDYVITLEIEGKKYTTEKLRKTLGRLLKAERKTVIFVIGGSHGLSDEVKRRSDEAISFAKATYPHQLMKAVLLSELDKTTK